MTILFPYLEEGPGVNHLTHLLLENEVLSSSEDGEEKGGARKPCSGDLGKECKVKGGCEQYSSFQAANQAADLTLLLPKTLVPCYPAAGLIWSLWQFPAQGSSHNSPNWSTEL